MLNILQQILLEWGLGEDFAATGARTSVSILVALAALIAHRLARGPVLRTITSLIRRTNTQWDDALIERGVLHRLAHLVPGLVIYRLAPLALVGHARLQEIVDTGVLVYLVLTSMLVIDALMSTTVDIYRSTETSREISIKGLIQFLKVILYFLCGVFVVSVLLGKSPFYLLSGLTALTAVLLLIFRDAILGLVAGIQLSVNRMVARGDWIEMPKYGADGDVLDVTLTTVKVQNWDKTITTIPTYSLISESFKNWRGMQDSGGRRIKRSVYIDISTVKFLDEEMIERFGKIQYITDHIERKKQELAEYNELNQVDLSHLANGRRMTNVGTFRAYVEAYLKNHPQISQEMTFLIRQLAPTPKGLPIEIYVFCKDKVWANYEAIQGDIFDHILAIIPVFDLQAFQEPAGKDFRGLNPAD
ncbi:MAG: mechanosensitive ion channel domain-containing protein [Candidatus Latescibacterota bacterium]|nr:mechanosensitive ion channel domain-containing protein [Candidatus Latescibacterota bacterium]